jgi:predicted DCC family thiol-disulfide oxidoreductase YuxK
LILVFVAECLLCSGWVQFLLRRDRERRFRFASMQSDAGRALLTRAGVDAQDPETFVLVDGEHIYSQSDAILRVLRTLGWPWRISAVLRVIPAALRDVLYRWLARNRYRWFGRRQTCYVPEAHDAARFIR